MSSGFGDFYSRLDNFSHAALLANRLSYLVKYLEIISVFTHDIELAKYALNLEYNV